MPVTGAPLDMLPQGWCTGCFGDLQVRTPETQPGLGRHLAGAPQQLGASRGRQSPQGGAGAPRCRVHSLGAQGPRRFCADAVPTDRQPHTLCSSPCSPYPHPSLS